MNIELRLLTSPEEFADAVRVQRIIWGFDDIDLLPVRFFKVASSVGGHVIGAYDGDLMAGFCLDIPGIKHGPKPFYYLHSHMMGVLAEYRNAGLGKMLKFRQREEALREQVPLIEWTFDPLELKNAFFNIERLGCVVRRYTLNQYGNSSSRLQAGLPTDRCTAEWWLSAPAGPRPEIEARIEIPNTIGELKLADPARAREIQASVSQRFQDLLRQGLAVVGFDRLPDSGAYLFGRWTPPEIPS